MIALLLPLTLLPCPALAQAMDPNMPGMDMPGMEMSKGIPASSRHAAGDSGSDCEECQVLPTFYRPPFHGTGTSRLPGFELPSGGKHFSFGSWMLMLHGAVSTQYTSVSGPRGDSKVYATSMAMLMAERETAWGRVQLKSMMSLEPLMDAAGYPSLFTTGETAHGVPLVDRQHPHDLFMELAGRVDINAGQGSLFVYGGPVGEPALGPSAFMHRRSAAVNPEPPITHHWLDSTHISYGVVTVGYAARRWQIEVSAFRGQEPDEHRWNIETPRLDSWSVRATFNPTPSWAMQASYGFLKAPEAAHPGENERRFTTSIHYANRNGLSAMAGFSAKRTGGQTHTAWIGEANWNVDLHTTLFGRFENVDNPELFPDPASPLHDKAFRVSKFQLGYARRIPLGPFGLALGAAGSAYAKPAALTPFYGAHPLGYTLFARISLGR